MLFSGSVDQSYIPHAIAYASCIGHHANRCTHDSSINNNNINVINDTIMPSISCPSAEPNSAAISSDVMNDQARNPTIKSNSNNLYLTINKPYFYPIIIHILHHFFR